MSDVYEMPTFNHGDEMNDDLIKRLRVANSYSNPNFVNPFVEPIKAEAADHIEQLMEERDTETWALVNARRMQTEAEAKLAKAVEALRIYAKISMIGGLAREVLAELEGGK